MLSLVNKTPFACDFVSGFDVDHSEYVVALLSASFEFPSRQAVRVAAIQHPVRAADVCFGKPGESSVRYEGEIAPFKPRADVLVNATAYAPGGEPVTHLSVSLRVGALQKTLRVTGDRKRLLGSKGPVVGAPVPFVIMPVRYERAFGGTDRSHADPARHAPYLPNPVGVGYHGAMSADPTVPSELPNIELPHATMDSPLSKPEPGGFGAVGRWWMPRRSFGGTYDASWQEDQAPLLPADFDPRFHQAAPIDQQIDEPIGGQPVSLVNLTPDARWEFTVPRVNVPVRLRYADRANSVMPVADTLLIEPEQHRVTIVLRAKVPLARNRAPLKEIVFGHVSDAWWTARTRAKVFLDSAGTEGRVPGVVDFA